ncbi:MAG: chemotaxis protein CheW [Hungatella sp.]
MSKEYEFMQDQDEDDMDELAAENTNLERYLTFLSDGLTYAIDTSYVTEIITNHTITVLPMVPHYITGIINLRGAIVPILDIRARMNKAPTDISNGSCVIVLSIETVNLGIIIDEVSQVVDIDQTQISPMAFNNHQELVNGMINLSDSTTLLFLDCNLLVNH